MFLNRLCRQPARLHRDERGTISVVTLLVLLVFTMLLVMIGNVGRHADDKLKLQNATDAAAYSGGVTLARGLNGLAHTNHLLCEVCAITAYLREGRERNAEQRVSDILNAWRLAGADFQQSTFAPFPPLGRAIVNRVPLEQEAVTAFGEEQAVAAQHFLPVFEYILEAELIPKFQRTLVITTPQLAQEAARETARRHARPSNPLRASATPATGVTQALRPGDQPLAVIWQSRVKAIGATSELLPQWRTLPAVDPSPLGTDFSALDDGRQYLEDALKERRELANDYLEQWNNQRLELFDRDARMSRFGDLWRIAVRGQLDRLLTIDYPLSNLPFQIRHMSPTGTHPRKMRDMQQAGDWRQVNQHLDNDYHFLVVVYRKHLDEMGPGLFRNPLARESDTQAFAQIQLFLPERRYLRINEEWGRLGPPRFDGLGNPLPRRFFPYRDNWPTSWDLLSQNWSNKIMPARLPRLTEILARAPGTEIPTAGSYQPAPFSQLGPTTVQRLTTH